MLITIFLILIISVLSLQENSQVRKCPINKSKNKSLIQQFQTLSYIIQNDQQNIKNCLNQAIQLSQLQLVEHIAHKYRIQSNFNLYANSLLTQQLKRLKELSKWIVYQQSTCQPTIKWAQNQSHIFLTIKLSHRWDSPPCLNTLSQNVILNNQSFEYQNQCVVSNNKITFKKFIPLKKQVKRNSLETRKDGVGTYYVQFQKINENDIWSYLDSQNTNYLIWNQIADTYESAFKRFKDLRQQLSGFENEKASKIAKSQSQS